MIVRMKKVVLLCEQTHQVQTLSSLRTFGMVHVSNLSPPDSQDYENTKTDITAGQAVLDVLPAATPDPVSSSGRPAGEIISAVTDYIEQRVVMTGQLAQLKSERKRIEPFGDFDPVTLKRLIQNGINVRLYHNRHRARIHVPANATLSIIHRTKKRIYYAVIGAGDVSSNGEELLLPGKSLGQLRKEIDMIEQRLESIASEISGLAGDRTAIEKWILQKKGKVEFLEVQAGMGTAKEITYLQGYCPETALESLRATAKEQGWGLVVEEPAGDEPVPTLIENPRWIRPINNVLKMMGVLPGYREVDVSMVFLLFFSLFVAILVGDAGYGMVYLALTFTATRIFRKAPRELFSLLWILSICTIIWGVLTGSYFGISTLPGPLKALKIDWLNNESHMISLCFLIGAAHLTVAHAWNAIRMINSLQALAQVGWIMMTWIMFFTARFFVLGTPFPLPQATFHIGSTAVPFVLSFGGVALVLIMLFMTPRRRFKTEWPSHAVLPLTVVSNFVDVVSYIRLFAVGAATAAIASSFNAFFPGFGVDGLVAGLMGALIMFIGHAFNMVLAVMGVMVHGIRLNALEFATHMGMKWVGVRYRPFT